MAPTSNSTMTSPAVSAPTDTDVRVIKATEEESGLPGMKRGIAIGVACSVAIILIAILAFIAVRRRKRLAAKAAKTHTVAEVEGDSGFWPQEKPRQTEVQQVGTQRAPPVEADAQTIHELDAHEIPELPGAYATYELEAEAKRAQGLSLGDEYAQTQRQWEMWKYAPEDHHEQPDRSHGDSKHALPVLTVSSPGPHTSPHPIVSPLGQTPSDIASQRPFSYDTPSHYDTSHYDSPSPYDAPSPARSPFEEVHLLSNRNNGNYNMR